MAALVRRFSAVSLGSVVLLALTGWVNAWVLVGSFSNVFGQTYGRWLGGKIILFFSRSGKLAAGRALKAAGHDSSLAAPSSKTADWWIDKSGFDRISQHE
jgi:putative copper export protein